MISVTCTPVSLKSKESFKSMYIFMYIQRMNIDLNFPSLKDIFYTNLVKHCSLLYINKISDKLTYIHSEMYKFHIS